VAKGYKTSKNSLVERHVKTKKVMNRTILELLELLLKKVSATYAFYSTPGLCDQVGQMLLEKYITEEEELQLRLYLKTHKPSAKDGIHYRPDRKDFLYWWKPYEQTPRVAWVKYRIEIERNNNENKG